MARTPTIAHVRGSLGSQLACYMAAAALGSVDSIVLNAGGKLHPDSTVSYLPLLLVPCPRVRISPKGVEKARLDEVATLERIAAFGPNLTLSRPFRPTSEEILHVRVGDRQTTSDNRYIEEAKFFNLVVGNLNGNRLAAVFGAGKVAQGNAINDWFRILNASRVRSSMSWFTLSAAVINPSMRLEVMRPDGPILMPPAAYEATEWLVDHLPNAVWVP